MKTKTWTSVLTLAVGGAMIVASAFAQSASPSTDQASSSEVMAVQQSLKDMGHDPGPVDGLMGPKTSSAVRDFQKKAGLEETGQLNGETLSKLGIQTEPSASPATLGLPSRPSSGPGERIESEAVQQK